MSDPSTAEIPIFEQPPEASAYKPPPSEIAGIAAIEAEPDATAEGDARPSFDVRGAEFHVRAGIPALLAEKLAKVQQDMPKVPDGTTWGDLTPKLQQRFNAVRAVSYELLMNTIVEDERFEFEQFCIDTEPIMDAKELAEILGKALAAASGRPTEPS